MKALIQNYSLNAEQFEDAFDCVKYNLSTDEASGYKDAMYAVQMQLIISRLKSYLDEKFAR